MSLHEYAHNCFMHVAEHFGVSKYFEGFPCLLIENDPQELLSGEFRDDCCEIMVNLANFEHLDYEDARTEIARTITHEYVHYLQSPRWMTRYHKMYSYWDNPYEIEAYQREDELLPFLLTI